MTDVGSGSGDAHNAEAITLTREEYDALLARGQAPPLHDPIAEAHANVVSAQAKVDRQGEHLAAAQERLAEAQAALAAIEGA